MKKKLIIIASILVVIAVALVYNYTFNSKHRNIATEEATSTLTAKELFTSFALDEKEATTKYLDKVIAIQGEITAVEENQLVINNQVQVSFIQDELPNLTAGTSLVIKGRCVGYDELLELVKIDQATVLTKNK